MQLIPDFKTKYPKYWSVWCSVAGIMLNVFAVLEYAGMLLPIFETRLPPLPFFIASIVCAFAAALSRALKQPGLAPTEAEAADAPAK